MKVKTVLQQFTARETIKGAAAFLLFVLGLIFIFFNLKGVFTSLRNPQVIKEAKEYKFGMEMSLEEFYINLDKLQKNIELSDSAKIVQSTHLVNRSMVHLWETKGAPDYNIEIPLHENYLLCFLGRVYPKRFLNYEFCDWERAIERGVGLCSQHVIVERGILNSLGIKTKAIGLSGHVVLTAEYQPNKWFVADPDYGVIIPYPLDTIEKNANLIKQYYEMEGYGLQHTSILVGLFGVEGNYVAETYCENSLEDVLYLLIWIIPILCMAPFLLFIKSRI